MRLVVGKKWWILVAASVLCTLGACDTFKTHPPSNNQEPDVELANIPIPRDTLFALATLYWDGGDEDGFIAGYEYQYTSTFCETDACDNENTETTDWIQTDSTSQTIAFNSQEDLNKQVFRVRAIDDDGARSTIAEKTFYTTQTVPPQTNIATPSDGATRFAREMVSDWWRGIPVTFTARTGSDEAEIEAYGWRVDGGDYTWIQDTSVVIPPSAFMENGSLDGEHTIQITARDNTNLTADEGNFADTVSVTLIEPSFSANKADKKILIVDETDESTSDPPEATDAEVDAFYRDVFQPDRMWDYFKNDGPPPRSVLAQYDLVLWHADNYFSSANDLHQLPQHTQLLSDYMNVGGDFIMSGWRLLASFSEGSLQFYPDVTGFPEGSFIREYLHIRAVSETPSPDNPFAGGDFKGTKNCLERENLCPDDAPFSSAQVEASKILEKGGYLTRIDVIPSERSFITDEAGTASFTKPIYYYWQREYDNPDFEKGAPSPSIRFEIVGARYTGTVFDAAVFGFPLYFLKKEDAKTLAQEILHELGYR